MPSPIRPTARFSRVIGRLIAENPRFIARACSPSPDSVSLHPFVVIGCVAEESIGAPLCFAAFPRGATKALANLPSFTQVYPTN